MKWSNLIWLPPVVLPLQLCFFVVPRIFYDYEWSRTIRSKWSRTIWDMVLDHKMTLKSSKAISVTSSGVARAFPGGRLAHPEGQNEEEISKLWGGKKEKLVEIWGKNEESGTLAHPGLWGWLRPWWHQSTRWWLSSLLLRFQFWCTNEELCIKPGACLTQVHAKQMSNNIVVTGKRREKRKQLTSKNQ